MHRNRNLYRWAGCPIWAKLGWANSGHKIMKTFSDHCQPSVQVCYFCLENKPRYNKEAYYIYYLKGKRKYHLYDEFQFVFLVWCQTDCKTTTKGKEYNGTISVTESGRTCQMWGLQNPHRHRFKDTDFLVDGSKQAAKNYCRNIGTGLLPWCFTTDPRYKWDHCYIPFCGK